MGICKNDTYLNLEGKLFSTPNGLTEGDYQIQFLFDLDKLMPSSYNLPQQTVTISQEDVKERPFANCKYTIKAFLKGSENLNASYETELIINQQIKEGTVRRRKV